MIKLIKLINSKRSRLFSRCPIFWLGVYCPICSEKEKKYQNKLNIKEINDLCREIENEIIDDDYGGVHNM